jgi:kynurenine formamidase
MGRKDPSHFSPDWTPPTYTVDEQQKIAGGYTPTEPHNWGRWGSDDQRGTSNLIGPEQVLAAVGGVTKGKVFSLALPIDATAPGIPTRARPKHWFSATGSDAIAGDPLTELIPGFVYNDDVIELHTHGSTQWDGLAHVVVEDAMFNGYWAGSVTAAGGASVLGIEHQRESFVGRGVLLDAARHFGVDSLEPGTPISADDLDAICAKQGVEILQGDVLMLRTGYLSRWWALETPEDKAQYMTSWPGVDKSTVNWLDEHEVCAITCDTVAFEVMPFVDDEVMPVHNRLIVDLGLTIGEFWDLDALADDCAEDSVYTCLLVAPPLHLPRAVGSPLNPIAIK